MRDDARRRSVRSQPPLQPSKIRHLGHCCSGLPPTAPGSLSTTRYGFELVPGCPARTAHRLQQPRMVRGAALTAGSGAPPSPPSASCLRRSRWRRPPDRSRRSAPEDRSLGALTPTKWARCTLMLRGTRPGMSRSSSWDAPHASHACPASQKGNRTYCRLGHASAPFGIGLAVCFARWGPPGCRRSRARHLPLGRSSMLAIRPPRRRYQRVLTASGRSTWPSIQRSRSGTR